MRQSRSTIEIDDVDTEEDQDDKSDNDEEEDENLKDDDSEISKNLSARINQESNKNSRK